MDLSTMEPAIHREKGLKEWKQAWKPELIEGSDPDWLALYSAIV
jgi:predicted GIY-YIG superfamily endonuclease